MGLNLPAVADFFRVLESNEGPEFRLYYDDLPIYYVPAEFKDKLYLMANLFTRSVVCTALPMLLLLLLLPLLRVAIHCVPAAAAAPAFVYV